MRVGKPQNTLMDLLIEPKRPLIELVGMCEIGNNPLFLGINGLNVTEGE
jgi:hypothetical protein